MYIYIFFSLSLPPPPTLSLLKTKYSSPCVLIQDIYLGIYSGIWLSRYPSMPTNITPVTASIFHGTIWVLLTAPSTYLQNNRMCNVMLVLKRKVLYQAAGCPP